MVYVIAVRCVILHAQREYIGKLTGSTLHDLQQILGYAKNPALFYGVGDSEASGIDDTVALGGVYGQDSVQLGADFFLIDLGTSPLGIP